MDPNVENIRKHATRVIRGRIPLQVRKNLMAAVRNGELGRLPKKGLKPEIFFHPDHRNGAIERQNREAEYGIAQIAKVMAPMSELGDEQQLSTLNDLAKPHMPDEGVHEAELTAKRRDGLPASDFVFPKDRKYPIPDESHARNALARVAQHGTPDEISKVRAFVKRKFPDIDVDGDKEKASESTPHDIELLHLMLEGDAQRQLELALGPAASVREAAQRLSGAQRSALHERFSKRIILHSLRAFLQGDQELFLG